MALGTTAHTQMTATHSQLVIDDSNGAGVTVSNLGNYTSTSICNALWNVYTSYMKPKIFRLGNIAVCVYNCDNKYFMVDNVNFSFETQGTTVTLRVSTYGTTNLSSLDEVRHYIKSMKMYYLKCKEFEKQLELSSDFA